MSKRLLRLVILAVFAGCLAQPARAQYPSGTFEFEAYPCGLTCAVWLDSLNTDLNGDGEPELFFQPCEGGFPGTGYDELQIQAPAASSLTVRVAPKVAWDTYICSTGGVQLAQLQQEADAECTTPGGIAGCPETATIPATPGGTYVIRSYNIADPFPLEGSYEFH